MCTALGSPAGVGVYGSSFVSDRSPGGGQPLDKETLTVVERLSHQTFSRSLLQKQQPLLDIPAERDNSTARALSNSKESKL